MVGKNLRWGGAGPLVVNINIIVIITVIYKNAGTNWNWKNNRLCCLNVYLWWHFNLGVPGLPWLCFCVLVSFKALDRTLQLQVQCSKFQINNVITSPRPQISARWSASGKRTRQFFSFSLLLALSSSDTSRSVVRRLCWNAAKNQN